MERGVYTLGMETTLDVRSPGGVQPLLRRRQRGAPRLRRPHREHAGETLTTWLVALHFGSVRFGASPYRVFVCLSGILVALLSVTGVWIWLKKRPARVEAQARPREPGPRRAPLTARRGAPGLRVVALHV